jgi:hypothetical protein
MADELPLLRGRICRSDKFRPIRGGSGERPPLPDRDPKQHRAELLKQLNEIARAVAARPDGQRDPEATREIVAVRPRAGFPIEDPRSLADKKEDARLVSVDPDTSTVLLDVSDPGFAYLRRKLDQYADDAKVSKKSGERKNGPALAPVDEFGLAGPRDRGGPRFRSRKLARTDVRWFEIACRGGRLDAEATTSSRGQIMRTLTRLDVALPQEFLATERVVFFSRLSIAHLNTLLAAVDCVYEFDLASPDVRDWLLASDPEPLGTKIRLAAVAQGAPSVVLLDTGIATRHPLLRSLIATSISAVPEDRSPEDTCGHGTNMAGIAAFDDVGAVVEAGHAAPTHWIESAKVLTRPESGSAAEENRRFWPKTTTDAVLAVEKTGRRLRVYAMAVTANLDLPGQPTYWSDAVDELAYNNGKGRVILISIGNADTGNVELLKGYPTLSLEQKIADPAQAVNALTIGAFTRRDQVPPHADYEDFSPVAPKGGLSPHARAGPVKPDGALKPDVVFEGGNIAFDGALSDEYVETLVGLTTGHNFTKPLTLINGTSEATAHGAWFVAQILRTNRDLNPASIRGLVVHSADWTPAMIDQFPNVDERLAICGHGLPLLSKALSCVRERATVIVEDSMPNAEEVLAKRKPKKAAKRPRAGAGEKTVVTYKRVAKLFRMPLPEEVLLESTEEVELRVTLSYFAEPNTFARYLQRGLDLRWEMQGPTETEAMFLGRINSLARGAKGAPALPKGKRFEWDLGIRRRGRGTIQTDRWRGPASLIAGSKFVAVYPVLGWWDRRSERKIASMPFSLIVTVQGTGLKLYHPIETALAIDLEIET